MTILIYHRVGAGTGGEIDLPVERFDQQLAWLRAHHRVLSLDEAVAELEEPATDREPAVVITFDDGTADFVEHALPVLVRHRVPATLYLATAFVEERRPWPGGAPPVDWSGLIDAMATGLVDVGSHTHDHLLLDRAEPDQVLHQLDRSIELIGQRLGRAPRHFAYPKAVAGSSVADAAVRERFVSAAIAGTRANPWGRTDLHRLARSPIQTSDGLRWFRRKAEGGLRLEDGLRDRLNRVRYRDRVD